VRALGPVAGLLGGLCWLLRWFVDAGATSGWSGPLHRVGLGLLVVALAAVGAGLVSRSPLWLRVVVAVAFPLLAWSLYSVIRGDGHGVALDGAIGLLAVVCSAAAAATARRTAAPAVSRGGRHGSHVAR